MFAQLWQLLDARPFRGRVGPEDRIAIDVANYLKAEALEGRLKGVFTHIPHEVGGGYGNASKTRYALAKAMGLVAGSGDYVFAWPDGGGFIELKTPTGSLNPAQRLFRDWCVDTKTNYAVCRSVEEVAAKLFSWGALRK